MKCPNCGHPMNHHADKLLLYDDPNLDAASPLLESYSCPHCGANDARLVQPD
jgi:hypothetical protein